MWAGIRPTVKDIPNMLQQTNKSIKIFVWHFASIDHQSSIQRKDSLEFLTITIFSNCRFKVLQYLLAPLSNEKAWVKKVCPGIDKYHYHYWNPPWDNGLQKEEGNKNLPSKSMCKKDVLISDS